MLTLATRGRGMRAVLLGVVLAVAVSCVSILLASPKKPAEASFPGKNGFIAFTGYPDGDSEISKIRSDGSGLKQITHNTVDDYEPAWSPDGSKIAFRKGYRDPAKESAIFVKDITAGETVQLSDPNDSMDDWDPAWSPDSSKIGFVSSSNGMLTDLWVMNADGSGRKRLTTTSGSNPRQPDWSPDGSKIAFSNGSDIWVMNADGTNLQSLIRDGSDTLDARPSWSPDGSKIAFERRSKGGESYDRAEIWRMNADGSAKTNLTNTPLSNEFAPAWSPNGRQIAFWRPEEVGGIWAMYANGTGQRNITNNTAVSSSQAPDWQAIP